VLCLRELEIEEKRAERDDRRAEREREDRRAEREMEMRRAEGTRGQIKGVRAESP